LSELVDRGLNKENGIDAEALRAKKRLVKQLEKDDLCAVTSLRKEMEKPVTVIRRGLPNLLQMTLRLSHPILIFQYDGS
jgi:hypothetical protein